MRSSAVRRDASCRVDPILGFWLMVQKYTECDAEGVCLTPSSSLHTYALCPRLRMKKFHVKYPRCRIHQFFRPEQLMSINGFIFDRMVSGPLGFLNEFLCCLRELNSGDEIDHVKLSRLMLLTFCTTSH